MRLLSRVLTFLMLLLQLLHLQLMLSNRFHHLLLLRRLQLEPLLNDSQHLRCFHGFVRLSEQ